MPKDERLLDHLAKALHEFAEGNGPIDYASVVLACEVLKTTMINHFINQSNASYAESSTEVGS